METEQTVELFCGERKAFSAIASALGFGTFTLDVNPQVAPNLIADIRTVFPDSLPKEPLIVWAAPPDAGFASEHWNGIDALDREGEVAMEIFRATVASLTEIGPKWWFIENPKGILRKQPIVAGFNRGYPTRNRHTIRHDEYGGDSPELTDVWTNAYWWVPRPGPRDSKGGIKSGRRVPPMVFSEIFGQLEVYRTTGFYGPRD